LCSQDNVTGCAYKNNKIETCITLNNINYTVEFSKDTQNDNQITVKNNNLNNQDNVFDIIENTKQVNTYIASKTFLLKLM